MNLSKIFFDSLENECEETAIWKALKEVDLAFSRQLLPDTSEEECIAYFFENPELLILNERYKELIEFWNAVEPYIWNWPNKDLESLWVIQTIRNLEGIKQVSQYNLVLDQCSSELLKRLQQLSEMIEDTNQKKHLVSFSEWQNGYQVKNAFSLRWFDEQCYHPYRDYILRHLVQWMNEGSLVAIAADSTELFGFELGNNNWKVCETDVLESLRDMVFEIAIEDKRRGLIPGYAIADLW